MTTPTFPTTIEINMDWKCKKCGKKVASLNGLCLDCMTKAIERKGSMLDKISFDGIVTATSTNWPKHETRIAVGAMYSECGEIEAESLGEIIRDETTVNVSICDKENIGEIIEFSASISGARTDWGRNVTIVTFSVFAPDKFETKSAVVGKWGERSLPVTIAIVPAQGRLL
jgi:hypothetical protein